MLSIESIWKRVYFFATHSRPMNTRVICRIRNKKKPIPPPTKRPTHLSKVSFHLLTCTNAFCYWCASIFIDLKRRLPTLTHWPTFNPPPIHPFVDLPREQRTRWVLLEAGRTDSLRKWLTCAFRLNCVGKVETLFKPPQPLPCSSEKYMLRTIRQWTPSAPLPPILAIKSSSALQVLWLPKPHAERYGKQAELSACSVLCEFVSRFPDDNTLQIYIYIFVFIYDDMKCKHTAIAPEYCAMKMKMRRPEWARDRSRWTRRMIGNMVNREKCKSNLYFATRQE